MASDSPTPSQPSNLSSPRGPRPRGRGGRDGTFRRQDLARDNQDGGDNEILGDNRRGRGGRGRGRGRGRGGIENFRNPKRASSSQEEDGEQPSPVVPPPVGPANRGSFGARLTEDADKQEGDGRGGKVEGVARPSGAVAEGETGDDDDDVEAEVCFICASPVVHNSVAPCNHRTCHICALRLRALYKTKACAHCRTVSDFVVFTDDGNKRYDDFKDGDFSNVDNNLGIKYEHQGIFEDTVLLLRYNCPDATCDVACLGWPDLHRHVKSVHHRVMCDLCTRNKKVFTHEHELFTPSELHKHQKYGDDNPGAVDQSGFKGHPECGFCRLRFYGDDELYAHCREKHERCFLCDRRNQGRQQQYYLDYNALETHFRKDHFLCPDTECLEKKFVVFDSEMDLKAHQLEAHPNGLTKDARRDARRVDMSTFDFRSTHQQQRRDERNERRDRGRGRGRDPNAEPLPVSTAQSLRRDEVAFQRQMAIQSAQSIAPRTFGGQLTQDPTPALAARPASRAVEPATVSTTRPSPAVNENFPSLGNLSINNNSNVPAPASARPASPSPQVPFSSLNPQEQARRLRHGAVTERAANLLQNSQTKLTQFRNHVASYRSGAVSASGLIDAFVSLFDTSTAELGKLVKELAEIFEIPGKKEALLKAWSDHRAVNEDYPTLPMPSASTTNANTMAARVGAAAGSKVLRLKSSTAQSSRSAIGTRAAWGSAGAAPSASSSNPFPGLPAPTSVNRIGKGRVGPTPWAGASSTTSSAPRSVQPSRTSTPAIAGSSEAFPALPAAAKPQSSLFRPGYTGNAVKRGTGSGSATPVNAWNSAPGSKLGSADASEVEGDFDDAADDMSTQVNGKRKGRKKQTLFHFG